MSIINTIGKALKGIAGAIAGKENKLPHDIPNREDGADLIISALEMQFQRAVNVKMPYERSWFLNKAAILGHHWVEWDNTNKIYDFNQFIPDWRVQHTDNQLLKSYRKRLSKISSYNPKYVVTANSSETADLEASRLGTKVVLGFQQTVLDWRLQKLDRTEKQLQCGNVFHTFGWDPMKGKKLPDVKGQSQTLYEGDIYTEVVDPFEIYCLSGSGAMSNWTRMMRCRWVGISKIKELFPETSKDLKPENQNTMLKTMQSNIDSLNSDSSEYIMQSTDNTDGAYLKYVWERRSSEHPKGRFIAYANGILLDDRDIPNIELGDEFEFPFFHYQDLVVSGRTWGQAIVEQQLPVNQKLDEIESQFIEYKDKAAKPKTFIAKGTIDKNAITDEPNEVVQVDMTKPGAFQPFQIPLTSMPNYVVALPRIFKDNIDDLGATHDSSNARATPNASSGKAILALQGADNSDLSPLLLRNSENDRKMLSALLKLVQAKYKEERLIKIAGTDNVSETISFRGADLKGNTDVWMEEGDMIPMTRQERELAVQEKYASGLLGNLANDETRKRALRMMEQGKVDEMFEEATEDTIQARNENAEMNKGVIIIPEAWENQSSHLLEHRKEMKKPLFEKKPLQIQAIYEAHCQGHETFLFPQPEPQPQPTGQPVNQGIK